MDNFHVPNVLKHSVKRRVEEDLGTTFAENHHIVQCLLENDFALLALLAWEY